MFSERIFELFATQTCGVGRSNRSCRSGVVFHPARYHSIATSVAMSQLDPLIPRDFDVEEAETANMETLEQGIMRSAATTMALDGSRPSKLEPKKRFQHGVRRAMIAKRLSEQKESGGTHRRRNSTAQDLLRHISDDIGTDPTSTNQQEESRGHARHRSYEDSAFLPPLFEDTDSVESENDGDNRGHDRRHLLSIGTRYGTSPGGNAVRPCHRGTSSCSRVIFSRGFWSKLLRAILHSTLLWGALPCAISALILYYPLANPIIDFLPGSVTVAWWFNFMARQMVTFELARLLEYAIVDSLLLKSRWDRTQFVSFVAYHIEGWPFTIAAWATIDLFILHGNHRLQVHWLYWTRWRVYSHEASSGAYILTSELYLRVLLSMIFLGFATAVKRCFLELQFGGRLHTTFKPKLEQILRVGAKRRKSCGAVVKRLRCHSSHISISHIQEIVLVTEVAALGEEADFVKDLVDVDAASFRAKASKDIGGLASQAVDWSTSSVLLQDTRIQASDTVGTQVSDDIKANTDLLGASATSANVLDPQSITGIEALLDRWDEPIDKDNKVSNGTRLAS